MDRIKNKRDFNIPLDEIDLRSYNDSTILFIRNTDRDVCDSVYHDKVLYKEISVLEILEELQKVKKELNILKARLG